MIKIDKEHGYTYFGEYIFRLDEYYFEYKDYDRFEKWAKDVGIKAKIDAYMDIGCIGDIDRLGIIISKYESKKAITLCALKWR